MPHYLLQTAYTPEAWATPVKSDPLPLPRRLRLRAGDRLAQAAPGAVGADRNESRDHRLRR